MKIEHGVYIYIYFYFNVAQHSCSFNWYFQNGRVSDYSLKQVELYFNSVSAYIYVHVCVGIEVHINSGWGGEG